MHFDSIVDVSFFLGIGVGFGLAIDPLYISEITPASHRGEIVTWSEIAINVGVVLGFCSGIIFYDVDDSLEWRLMFLMGCILPLIVILVSQYIMPESPRWLVSKNRTEEAKVILRNIYPNNQHQQIETVIRDIQEALQRERLAENTMGWTMLLCPTPAIRRMLLVGIGMAISQQAVGIDAIQYYLIEIIASAGMESDKAQLGVLIILGVLKLMFVVIASKVVDKRGRKPLLLLSLAGMCGACIMISFSFLGNEDENNASTRSAFTILGLSLYLSFFSIGMGPIAWLVPSEIFATSIRAKAMSVAVFSNRIVATVMASTFLSTANAIGWGAFFLVLAAIAVVVAIFVYFVLPETKGRSLEDMSMFFAEITNDTSILEAEKQIIESRSGDFECNNNINIRRRSNVVEMKDLQQQITISTGELT
jgi:sugar porter (SP) family MFS transporter